MAEQPPRPSSRRESASVGEVIEFVKTYAKQETIGPLKGAGRWIGVGAAGAIALGLGLSLLLLGLLRLIQTEWDRHRRGRLVVDAVPDRARRWRRSCWRSRCLRINKTFLTKDPKR